MWVWPPNANFYKHNYDAWQLQTLALQISDYSTIATNTTDTVAELNSTEDVSNYSGLTYILHTQALYELKWVMLLSTTIDPIYAQLN